MAEHIARRDGERKRRLLEGHLFAERLFCQNVWWPLFGHFAYFHPEYEVIDFLEGRRFIDFAYVRHPIRIAFEVDGYGPHLKNISRRQFSDQWIRQMHLLNAGWIVVRLSFDDLNDRPRVWQQLIQQFMGRLYGDPAGEVGELSGVEREVVQLAMQLGRPLKLQDIKAKFQCCYRYARKLLQQLEHKNWLTPEGGGVQRTHSWRLNLTQRHIPF